MRAGNARAGCPATSSARPRRLPGNEIRTIETAMRFVLWASQLRAFPTPDQVRERFSCSRATAYRYRNLYADAIGVEPPKFEQPDPGVALRKARRRNP